MTDVPRDYRDPADLDEALDTIRVVDRDKAHRLFRSCLDCAYQQGRVEGADKAANLAYRHMVETLMKRTGSGK